MRKKKLKLLCVIPGKPDTNFMIFARNECNRIRKSGYDTKEYYLDFSSGFNEIVRQTLSLKKLIKKFRPQVVHAHFGSLTAFICALIKITPLVITYRGSDLNPSPSDGFIRDKLQKLFSQFAAIRADAIICVSKELKQRLWWNKNKVRVITTGVDTELFFPIDRNKARKILGLDTEEKIVLFTGGGTPKVKRLDLARESVAVAETLVGKIRFIILYGNVNFTDMPFYYNAADCLLFTSDYEGSPCAIQEAIACGVPIISVKVGDIKERLKGITNCKIVDRNSTIIGKAIVAVLTNGKRTNGAKLIKNLTTVKTTDMLIKAYKSCI